MIEAWKLAMMEDYGLTDTDTGLVNRVARRLAGSPNDVIGMVGKDLFQWRRWNNVREI